MQFSTVSRYVLPLRLNQHVQSANNTLLSVFIIRLSVKPVLSAEPVQYCSVIRYSMLASVTQSQLLSARTTEFIAQKY